MLLNNSLKSAMRASRLACHHRATELPALPPGRRTGLFRKLHTPARMDLMRFLLPPSAAVAGFAFLAPECLVSEDFPSASFALSLESDSSWHLGQYWPESRRGLAEAAEVSSATHAGYKRILFLMPGAPFQLDSKSRGVLPPADLRTRRGSNGLLRGAAAAGLWSRLRPQGDSQLLELDPKQPRHAPGLAGRLV